MISGDCASHASALCADDRRRQLVLASGSLGGVDYVEVYPDGISLCVHLFGHVPDSLSQRNVAIEGGDRIRDIRVVHATFEEHDDGDTCLRVTVDRKGDFSTYCLCLVEPGEAAVECSYDNPPPPGLSRPVPQGIDPRYACAPFSFRIDCLSDADCKPAPCPSQPPVPAPAIDYLARDFSGFRQLLLDRLAVTMPEWRERHIPDIGITVVELLAYVADRLSYQLDAIATEAYLGTARRRVSVRRHARLVDYRMHEGCNARALVTVETDQDVLKVSLAQLVFAAPPASAVGFAPGMVPWTDLEHLAGATLFEPIDCSAAGQIDFLAAHSTIHFHTWHGERCCLPAGSTRATLVDGTSGGTEDNEARRLLRLAAGDIVIVEEIRGAVTGAGADADPGKRHAVRLTRVEPAVDPVDGTPLLEVEWGRDDALPFALCVSARTAPRAPEAVPVRRGARTTVAILPQTAPGIPRPVLVLDTLPQHGEAAVTEDGSITYAPVPDYVGLDELTLIVTDRDGGSRTRTLMFNVGESALCEDVEVGVMRGNVLLVDHGRTIFERNDAWVATTDVLEACCVCDATAIDVTAGVATLSVMLSQIGITHATCACEADAPASTLCMQDPRNATAAVALDAAEADPAGAVVHAFAGTYDWRAVPDLIDSAAADRHFVAEIDDDGYAKLRFGDGDCGRAPPSGSRFRARYRVGNGTAGNVGAGAIVWMTLRDGAIDGARLRPRNPMAACGGTEPEPIERVKQYAPHAYGRVLERAVTAADYATIGGHDARVQGAHADLAWTGAWYEAAVGLDVHARDAADTTVTPDTLARLRHARRVGHDVRLIQASRVPLAIELDLCIDASYPRASVTRAVLDLMSDRVLGAGSLGLFHPDRLVFGGDVAASAIVAAVQSQEGVAHVEMVKFARAYDDAVGAQATLASGVIAISADEIAQLDNDPDFPERGSLKVNVKGGR